MKTTNKLSNNKIIIVFLSGFIIVVLLMRKILFTNRFIVFGDWSLSPPLSKLWFETFYSYKLISTGLVTHEGFSPYNLLTTRFIDVILGPMNTTKVFMLFQLSLMFINMFIATHVILELNWKSSLISSLFYLINPFSSLLVNWLGGPTVVVSFLPLTFTYFMKISIDLINNKKVSKTRLFISFILTTIVVSSSVGMMPSVAVFAVVITIFTYFKGFLNGYLTHKPYKVLLTTLFSYSSVLLIVGAVLLLTVSKAYLVGEVTTELNRLEISQGDIDVVEMEYRHTMPLELFRVGGLAGSEWSSFFGEQFGVITPWVIFEYLFVSLSLSIPMLLFRRFSEIDRWYISILICTILLSLSFMVLVSLGVLKFLFNEYLLFSLIRLPDKIYVLFLPLVTILFAFSLQYLSDCKLFRNKSINLIGINIPLVSILAFNLFFGHMVYMYPVFDGAYSVERIWDMKGSSIYVPKSLLDLMNVIPDATVIDGPRVMLVPSGRIPIRASIINQINILDFESLQTSVIARSTRELYDLILSDTGDLNNLAVLSIPFNVKYVAILLDSPYPNDLITRQFSESFFIPSTLDETIQHFKEFSHKGGSWSMIYDTSNLVVFENDLYTFNNLDQTSGIVIGTQINFLGESPSFPFDIKDIFERRKKKEDFGVWQTGLNIGNLRVNSPNEVHAENMKGDWLEFHPYNPLNFTETVYLKFWLRHTLDSMDVYLTDVDNNWVVYQLSTHNYDFRGEWEQIVIKLDHPIRQSAVNITLSKIKKISFESYQQKISELSVDLQTSSIFDEEMDALTLPLISSSDITQEVFTKIFENPRSIKTIYLATPHFYSNTDIEITTFSNGEYLLQSPKTHNGYIILNVEPKYNFSISIESKNVISDFIHPVPNFLWLPYYINGSINVNINMSNCNLNSVNFMSLNDLNKYTNLLNSTNIYLSDNFIECLSFLQNSNITHSEFKSFINVFINDKTNNQYRTDDNLLGTPITDVVIDYKLSGIEVNLSKQLRENEFIFLSIPWSYLSPVITEVIGASTSLIQLRQGIIGTLVFPETESIYVNVDFEPQYSRNVQLIYVLFSFFTLIVLFIIIIKEIRKYYPHLSLPPLADVTESNVNTLKFGKRCLS